ncbi:MAG: glycoside hydrolase family 127 protein [Clostridia bacterium]|nr:glycoside hydrolase family 127 protein [Clostridia bacterium]
MLSPINAKHGIRFSGDVGKLIENLQNNWLVSVPETNPSIISVFRERDRKPYRRLLPWSGEFAGKYITGAYYIYKITRDERLCRVILDFSDQLIECQDSDGYLGCFKKESRMTGKNSYDEPGTWDAWNHYHIMYGLYLWFTETKNEKYLEAVEKTASMFLGTFYNGKKRLKDIGSTETNLAALHIFAVLYGQTGKKEYLDFALEIAKDVESEEGGGYISCMDSGNEFYQCRKPRWESLHVIMGIDALGRVTGEEKYRDVAEKIVYSILRTDVHNTGGFSTREQAVGTPFDNGAVELCCVIAFNALAAEVYRRKPATALADFLEISYYNAVMGSYSPSGRWSAYNTPMDGEKVANYNEIGFQSRAGSPDLNCCSANSGRGLGQLSEWAFLTDNEKLYINFYDPCSFETEDGTKISIGGDYPHGSAVTVSAECITPVTLMLHIPEWSKNTFINGEKVTGGEYFAYPCSAGVNNIKIEFDFSLRFELGHGDYEGKRCVFSGPVLFGCDLSENDLDLDSLPCVTDGDFEGVLPEYCPKSRKILLRLKNGLILSDFYRLGSSGSRYRTWI